MSTLGQSAARGASITLAAQLTRMGIQMLSVIVLSRLLDPRDYGLVAMVLAVIGIGEIFRDFGLSSAAIQAPDLSRKERDNLFWTNTVIGVLLATIVFGAAALVAWIYGQPELVPITQALALTFVLNGLATQFRAHLVRGLQFRPLAAVEVLAAVVGFVVALVAALAGLGLWALVLQQITTGAFSLLGMALAGRWRPGLPDRRVSIRRFVRFGFPLLASQLVSYAANNVDTWTVGYRFGPTVLGYYNRAFQLLMTPLSQIRAPSTTVALPVLSRLNADQSRFGEFLRKGQLALALPTGIALALVAGTADAAIPTLLGHQWDPSIPFLRLFAVAALFQTLAFVGYWVYLARALTNVLLRYSIASAAIKVTCVVLGSYWGPLGTAVGLAVAPAVSWPLSLWWLGRHTTVPLGALYANALRIITQALPVGLIAYGATWATSAAEPFVSLLAGAAAGIVFYLGIALVVPWFRQDLHTVRTMVALVRGARRPSPDRPAPS